MTMTYILNLDILPLDLHDKCQVCMSLRLAARVVTERPTERHTHFVKTITSIRCKNIKENGLDFLLYLLQFSVGTS